MMIIKDKKLLQYKGHGQEKRDMSEFTLVMKTSCLVPVEFQGQVGMVNLTELNTKGWCQYM